MRNAMRMAVAVGALMIAAGAAMPAVADVKAGVDAWQRGEYKKAVDIWRTDANRGDADAQFNLGQAYRLGRGVPVDLPVAAEWYRKAAIQGHVEAETNYGLTLFDQNKRREALPWLEKSVARGEPRAQMALGTMLYNGDGVERDFPRAYALIVRSSASGLPRAASVQTQMDEYIPLADRQKGLELAKQYEADQKRPQLPPEIAARGSRQVTELPPSAGPVAMARPPRGLAVATMPPARPTPPQTRPNPPVAASGGWKVQLGAFGDAGNARKLWGQIGGRFPGRQPYYVKSGALTRLLVGPFASKSEASSACGAVRPCVPVAP